MSDLNLETLVADTLLARAKANGKREVVDGMPFRASKLGAPFCEQILLARGVESREYDARALAIFEMGHLHAEFLRRVFVEDGSLVLPSVSVTGMAYMPGRPLPTGLGPGVHWDAEHEEWALSDPDLLLGCHIDFVLKGGVGVELKTMRSDAFWGRPAGPRSKGTEYGRKGQYGLASKPEHRIQAAACAILAEKLGFAPNGEPITDWRVVVVSKDDMSMADEKISSADVEAATERLLELKRLWTAGETPICECDEHYGAGRYVPYCSTFDGRTCCREAR